MKKARIDWGLNDYNTFDRDNAKLYEDKDIYKIRMDVPGVKASNISVKFEPEKNILKLSGTRKFNDKDIVDEHKFERNFKLSKPVLKEQISAEAIDGVLTVTLHKHIAESNVVVVPVSTTTNTDTKCNTKDTIRIEKVEVKKNTNYQCKTGDNQCKDESTGDEKSMQEDNIRK